MALTHKLLIFFAVMLSQSVRAAEFVEIMLSHDHSCASHATGSTQINVFINEYSTQPVYRSVTSNYSHAFRCDTAFDSTSFSTNDATICMLSFRGCVDEGPGEVVAICDSFQQRQSIPCR